MSQYLTTEDQELTQVASNLGWSDFCDWAKSNDGEEFAELVAFVEDGDAYDLANLANEIRSAMSANPPESSVRDTIKGILSFLAANDGAEMVMVTNGVTAGDDDNEDDEDEA